MPVICPMWSSCFGNVDDENGFSCSDWTQFASGDKVVSCEPNSAAISRDITARIYVGLHQTEPMSDSEEFGHPPGRSEGSSNQRKRDTGNPRRRRTKARPSQHANPHPGDNRHCTPWPTLQEEDAAKDLQQNEWRSRLEKLRNGNDWRPRTSWDKARSQDNDQEAHSGRDTSCGKAWYSKHNTWSKMSLGAEERSNPGIARIDTPLEAVDNGNGPPEERARSPEWTAGGSQTTSASESWNEFLGRSAVVFPSPSPAEIKGLQYGAPIAEGRAARWLQRADAPPDCSWSSPAQDVSIKATEDMGEIFSGSHDLLSSASPIATRPFADEEPTPRDEGRDFTDLTKDISFERYMEVAHEIASLSSGEGLTNENVIYPTNHPPVSRPSDTKGSEYSVPHESERRISGNPNSDTSSPLESFSTRAARSGITLQTIDPRAVQGVRDSGKPPQESAEMHSTAASLATLALTHRTTPLSGPRPFPRFHRRT